MSRFIMEYDGLRIVYGWDPPMQTFYYQVIDPELPEDTKLIATGGDFPEEISTVEELASVLYTEHGATLDTRMFPVLRKLRQVEAKPSPLQNVVNDICRNNPHIKGGD